MPRFKIVRKDLRLPPIDLEKQLLPDTFAHALCYRVDLELNIADFHAHYRSCTESAQPYDPAVLLKIVLLAYSRCMFSSRKMADCQEHVPFLMVPAPTSCTIPNLAMQ